MSADQQMGMCIDDMRAMIATHDPREVAKACGLDSQKVRYIAHAYGWERRTMTINRTIRENPNMSNVELSQMLADRGIVISYTAIWKRRDRMGLL